VIAPPPPFAFNAPVFNLYTSNLSGIEAWTRANMGARPGICVPLRPRLFQDRSRISASRPRPRDVTFWRDLVSAWRVSFPG